MLHGVGRFSVPYSNKKRQNQFPPFTRWIPVSCYVGLSPAMVILVMRLGQAALRVTRRWIKLTFFHCRLVDAYLDFALVLRLCRQSRRGRWHPVHKSSPVCFWLNDDRSSPFGTDQSGEKEHPTSQQNARNRNVHAFRYRNKRVARRLSGVWIHKWQHSTNSVPHLRAEKWRTSGRKYVLLVGNAKFELVKRQRMVRRPWIARTWWLRFRYV